MQGQGAIFATGSIDYPPEYQAMTHEALSRIGISKVMTITSTYDHRIIQGAESGQFLARVNQLLLGRDNFYDELFSDLGLSFMPIHWAIDENPAFVGGDQRLEEIEKQARVFELITMYRVRGHLNADIDPLGLSNVNYHPELDMEYHGLTLWDLDREFVTGGLGGTERATLRQILEMLKRYYCGSVGYEYRHIQGPEEKGWLRARIEADPPAIDPAIRKQLLWKLISAEAFERFLGRKYIGQKRFSVEGGETIVAVLDRLIDEAALAGVEDVTIGMSHRGRLNILANVVGKFCERIFTSFEGAHHPEYPHDVRDVKYHQGAAGEREIADGRKIKITVAPNPSHLEFVNPVVEGRVRAKQDRAGKGGVDRILPVLLHGDAAFAGEGVVAETLNMSLLDGYQTGGTIHIIVNNQIGFTTSPEQGRSSTYSTDVARMVQAPIFHVNGDDADAAYHTLKMAFEYRQKFHSDVVIDLLGFRRHGHNEGDEPTYTQPIMYQRVDQHPGARTKYGNKLVAEGVMTQAEIESLVEERYRRYENALAGAKEIVAGHRQVGAPPPPYATPDGVDIPDTGLPTERMREIAEALTHVPSQFNLNPKVVTLLSRRHKMAEGEVPVDWGVAEALAFASLVLEGVPVRISGEDSSRGTFSHRHAVFVDTKTGEKWTPIKNLSADQATFEIYDSPLSETGVLGFEYGYSIDAPETLVLWEAQFGDFVNVAQVIIDQFIVAGEAKWGQPTRLTLLLPHGYEGQGPEHSSARLERFLQLCAEGNMQVCYPSTPAQIFHLLRRQARLEPARPLVVMTPKSLLRLPEASSSIERITSTGFKPVMDDPATLDPQTVRKVVLTCGKLYYDISAERAKRGQTDVALVRVEQFYPFPKANLAEVIARYPNATSIVWAQEEPRNMGAWTFMQPRLWQLLGSTDRLAYIGRRPGASTATGSYPIHQMEQKRLVDDALS
jgi:2-oxoglutarate dehydrogenase E1 component